MNIKSRSSHLQRQYSPAQDEAKYLFLFESLSLGLAYLEALFLKLILVSGEKRIKSSITRKAPKKSILFRRDVLL
jgi:hypothetical protein